MKYKIFGDIHGKHKEWEKLLLASDADCNLCVGDIGIGFRKKGGWITTNWLPHNTFYIHGNHDNPTKCVGQKGYLGRYGSINDFFFVSGADSIDREYRTYGVDWWPEEELSHSECEKALELYKDLKPDYVLSHDFPREVSLLLKEAVKGNGFEHIGLKNTPTRLLLQKMFEFHQPYYWIGGHWHTNFRKRIEKTEFICLNELDTFNLRISNI